MRKTFALGAALAALTAGLSLPAAAQSPIGTFASQTGDTRVRFADCGGQICGLICRSQTWTRVNEGGRSRSSSGWLSDALQIGRSILGLSHHLVHQPVPT